MRARSEVAAAAAASHNASCQAPIGLQNLARNEPRDLGRDEQRERLAAREPAHPERALSRSE